MIDWHELAKEKPTTDLKTCPFCGSKGLISKIERAVVCGYCHAQGPIWKYDFDEKRYRDDIPPNWNTRCDPDE